MRKKIYVNGAVLFLSCLFSIGIGELTLRLVIRPGKTEKSLIQIKVPEQKWTIYDSQLGWKNKPNTQAVLKRGEHQSQITIDSNGYRSLGTDSEKSNHSKNEGTVFFIGDSFTFGFGVNDDETFSALLSQKINYKVVNAGVAAYGLDQMALSIDSLNASADGSDLLIVGIFVEDFWRSTLSISNSGYPKPFFQIKGKSLVLRNIPVPSLEEQHIFHQQTSNIYDSDRLSQLLSKSYLFRFSKRGVIKFFKLLGWTDFTSSDDWVIGKKIIQYIYDSHHRRFSNIVFVLIPPKRWIEGTDEPIRQSFLNFCTEQSFDCLDLTTPLKAVFHATQEIKDLYIQDDDHWTRLGHEIAAEEIYKIIENSEKGNDE